MVGFRVSKEDRNIESLGLVGIRGTCRIWGYISVSANVGPPLLNRSSIMSFGARLFRIKAMIVRPPVMSFDCGSLQKYEGFSTIAFKSIHRDLRIVGAQRAVLRIPNFYFWEGPDVRGEGTPTY